jgi:two-component system OmpR family sensor kinase
VRRMRLRRPGWFERIPVRWRIAVTTAGLTLAILVGFAIVLGQVVGDRIRDDFKNELDSAASSLAAETRVAINTATGVPVISSPPLQDFAMPNDAVVRVVDEQGHPLASSDPGVQLGGPSDDMRESGDMMVATKPIPASEPVPTFVQYARPDEDVDATVARLWLFLGGGVLGGTVLALLAGLAVANRAMRPIASLTAKAREITSTRDPSQRMPIPAADDEVGELARTMDGMLEALDQARSEREQALDRQREFLADASHELRTPLTSVQANLELLQAAQGDLPEELHAVDSALSSTRRMSRLVSDLLLLARADTGRQVARTDVDLASVAAEAADEVLALAGDRRIERHLDRKLPIRGNPDELHRLVLNLLENSVRHTPDGTKVELHARRAGDEAVLEVADDGPGLQPGMEDQVFDRFVRGQGPADTAAGGGSGLGLAIVRAVAESHGGTVSAGSSNTGGARFTVRLPLEAIEVPDAEQRDRASTRRD